VGRRGGVELSAEPKFLCHLSYSYLDPVLHNQSPSQKTSSVFDTFLPPVGNGSGSPNSATLPLADYLQPGIPHHLFNANINYEFDFGLGFNLGAEVTSPINVTYGGTVKIPTQFVLNAGVFYRWKNYEVRVDFLNFTNQKNWATVSASNGIRPDLSRDAVPGARYSKNTLLRRVSWRLTAGSLSC
jgi:hypothetical protein